MAKMKNPDLEKIRVAALAYPGAHEDHPWGETVVKVKGKVFVFLGVDSRDGSYGLSVKLPDTAAVALQLPFAEPTGYGLGKSGWVSARFRKGDDIPVPMILEWLDESYRAVAPKTLVKSLDSGEPPPKTAAPKKRPAKKRLR